MRLIDADDLPISSIDMTDVGYYVSKYGQGIPAVYLEDIKDAPTIEPQENRWIPCSNKRPKENGLYITTTMHGDVFCDYWNGINFDRTEMVIAWMPLPEPYKEGTDER